MDRSDRVLVRNEVHADPSFAIKWNVIRLFVCNAVVTTGRTCIVHLSTADSVENFYVARKIFQTRKEQAEHAGGYSTCRINCVLILRLAACPDGRTLHVPALQGGAGQSCDACRVGG